MQYSVAPLQSAPLSPRVQLGCRHSWPLVYRGQTFVVVIPGEIIAERQLMQGLMSDISLLHSLGVRLVLVLGTQPQIDDVLQARGAAPVYVGGYRYQSASAGSLALCLIKLWCRPLDVVC